jgi:hypothetical protein
VHGGRAGLVREAGLSATSRAQSISAPFDSANLMVVPFLAHFSGGVLASLKTLSTVAVERARICLPRTIFSLLGVRFGLPKNAVGCLCGPQATRGFRTVEVAWTAPSHTTSE